MFKKRLTCIIITMAFFVSCKGSNEIIEVSSLQELSRYLSQDNVTVKLAPGEYHIANTDLSHNVILKKYNYGKPETDYPVSALLYFSGNNSKYILNDVIIHLDTKLHKAFGKNHIFEVFVSGNDNTVEGLEVRDIGVEHPIRGAIMMHVMGDGNIIRNVKLHIQGSYPYGYGHLLGKGANPIVTPQKHSSLLVSGKDTKLLDCTVITRGFGHGIVMQGAVNTFIKDCYVEGEMRSTDAMLAETSGPAFETGFASDYPPGKILPNEMKALSEDGVRSYPYGYLVGRKTENITVINTIIKNMRSGIDLNAHIGKTEIENCTTIGCQEKGYSVASNAVVKNSRGDAQYGPLLSFPGNNVKNCQVELELMPNVGDYPVTRLAEINGSGHIITIKNYDNKNRTKVSPIVFGESFWSDVHRYRNPDSDPKKFSGANNITLNNQTGMPIVFKELSENNKAVSNGELLEDLGKNNVFEKQ